MRIEVLTFLRFIAAVIVVTFHFAKKSPLVAPSPGFLTAGPEMVSFFFVLSGFVLAVSHWKRPDQPLWQFYWARFARIAPLYFLALAATVALLAPHDKNIVTAQALFVQSWLLGTPISLNYPGWSISVEMFFYAIFPFALSLARDSRFRPRVLLVASLAAWAMTQVVVVYLLNARVTLAFRGSLHDLIYYFPVVHLCSFLLGVAGGAWYLTEGQARRRGRLTTSLLAMASLIVAYLALEYRDKWNVIDGVYVPTSAALLSPLFLWVVLALARAEGPVARFFSRKPFVLLGEASFAFYILEVPVDALYMRYLLPGRPNRGFDWSPGHFMRFVGILLVAAIASVYLFERPVRRLMMRLIPKPGPQRAQAVAATWTGATEVAVAGVSTASLVDSGAERT